MVFGRRCSCSHQTPCTVALLPDRSLPNPRRFPLLDQTKGVWEGVRKGMRKNAWKGVLLQATLPCASPMRTAKGVDLSSPVFEHEHRRFDGVTLVSGLCQVCIGTVSGVSGVFVRPQRDPIRLLWEGNRKRTTQNSYCFPGVLFWLFQKPLLNLCFGQHYPFCWHSV